MPLIEHAAENYAKRSPWYIQSEMVQRDGLITWQSDGIGTLGWSEHKRHTMAKLFSLNSFWRRDGNKKKETIYHEFVSNHSATLISFGSYKLKHKRKKLKLKFKKINTKKWQKWKTYKRWIKTFNYMFTVCSHALYKLNAPQKQVIRSICIETVCHQNKRNLINKLCTGRYFFFK